MSPIEGPRRVLVYRACIQSPECYTEPIVDPLEALIALRCATPSKGPCSQLLGAWELVVLISVQVLGKYMVIGYWTHTA